MARSTFIPRCPAILALVIAPIAAQAQNNIEVPFQPNQALAAFKERAWSLKEGRIQVISDIPFSQASATCLRIQAVIRNMDQVFDGMRARRKADDLAIWIILDRNEYLSAAHLVGGRSASNTSGLATYDDEDTNVFVNGLKWTTIQHECWHAANSIFLQEMPSWMDEGLAEVFEDGVFFGDQFAIGELPPRKLGRALSVLQSGGFVPLSTFLQQGDQWGHQLRRGVAAGKNQYLEAWSIMYFLLFGDNGAHRHKVNTMMRMINQGQSWRSALHQAIGSDSQTLKAFEETIVRFLRQAQPIDLEATHGAFRAWAEEWAATLPPNGEVDPAELAESLRSWMADPIYGIATRDLTGRIQINSDREDLPPIVSVNPLDGMSWTISWEPKPPPDEKSDNEDQSKQLDPPFTTSVRWGFSS